MKETTLCFLIREGEQGRELLLGFKKQGFGEKRWNGAGGYFEPEDKDIIRTVMRETKEELGVVIQNFEKVAIFDFLYSDEKECSQRVHIFLCREWEGKPMDSKEMTPRWFKEEEIPFDEMWPDDKFWLPRILKGEKLKGNFTFEQRKYILGKNIQPVENLD